MKNHVVAAMLVAALVGLGLGACFQAARYFFTVRRLAAIQNQVNQVNFRLNVAQALVNEAVEYSKRNPAIDPLLQQFHFKMAPATNAASPAFQPAAK